MGRFTVATILMMCSCTFDGSASGPAPGQQDTDAGSPGDEDATDSDAVPPDATDTDNDGVPDSSDNCVALSNSSQYDEDGDGFGDLCDNCPQSANPTQANIGETQNAQTADAIGDLCDPRPDQAGDVQVLFLGFNEASDLDGFSKAGPNDFAVVGGMLQQRVNTDLALLWRNDLGVSDGTIEAKLTYRDVTTGSYRFRGIAILGMFERSTNFGTGLGCGEMLDIDYDAQAFRNRVRFNGGGFSNFDYGNASVVEARTAIYRVTTAGTDSVSCVAGDATWSSSGVTTYSGTGVAVSTWGTGVDMEYLMVYSR